MWRPWMACGLYVAASAVIVAGGVSPATAADEPVVVIFAGSVTPARLEVHLGERVRWWAPGGQRVRIELDPHRDAHEVVVREGEIHAVFLVAGEHWYRGTLMDDERQSFRGLVHGSRSDRIPANLQPRGELVSGLRCAVRGPTPSIAL